MECQLKCVCALVSWCDFNIEISNTSARRDLRQQVYFSPENLGSAEMFQTIVLPVVDNACKFIKSNNDVFLHYKI